MSFKFQNYLGTPNNSETVPSGCALDLHSIFIEPETNQVENYFESKHYGSKSFSHNTTMNTLAKS